ncbi:MAG: phosphate regulon transcriptional regulatory protein PhoB [Gammaproteobacteria bacterium]|nr:MAG: phosphate regulon transcriptional regulatory protein PhoB [Gammaproteobacteria bacterium]
MVDSSLILVVEDENPVSEMLSFILEKEGWRVLVAEDVARARSILEKRLPDLILLDWMLPGISGIEFASQLKGHHYTKGVPIIMLTARGEEDDVVVGLDSGVDDYITKPFSSRELLARIRAMLRRNSQNNDELVIEIKGLAADPSSHRVMFKDQTMDVGPIEFRLLHYFMTHPERVYSRSQILDRVWGRSVFVEERTVDVYIRRLRRILKPTGTHEYIQTVRGAGYRFSTRIL